MDSEDKKFEEAFSDVFEALRRNQKPISDETKEFVERVANDVAEALGVSREVVDVGGRPEFGSAYVIARANKLNALNPVAFSDVLRRTLNFDVCVMSDNTISFALLIDIEPKGGGLE